MTQTHTEEITDLELITIEELKDSIPCEADEHCKSSHTEPAHWMVTHETSDGSCTKLFCDPCVVDIQKWIAMCVVTNGGHYHCTKCHVDFYWRTFVFREI